MLKETVWRLLDWEYLNLRLLRYTVRVVRPCSKRASVDASRIEELLLFPAQKGSKLKLLTNDEGHARKSR